MDNEALKEGKARVRLKLIEPLERLGLCRPSHQKAAEYADFLADIEARLAYMSGDGLAALADQIERMAAGDKWPKPVFIFKWARRIEEPPASDSRLVRSYLKSQGRRAISEGCLVRLYLALKQGGVPNDFIWRRIREQSQDDARRRVLIAERRARGAEDSADQGWLIHMNSIEARALSIVAEETGVSVADLQRSEVSA